MHDARKKPAPQQQWRPLVSMRRESFWIMVALAVFGILLLCLSEVRTLERSSSSDQQTFPPTRLQNDQQASAQPVVRKTAVRNKLDDVALRLVAMECAKKEETLISLDTTKRVVVVNEREQAVHVLSDKCPLLDVMLGAAERTIGACTDVAIYVVLMGARIFPVTANIDDYNVHCANKTARMFLEVMYPRWFNTDHPGTLHVMLPNPDNLQEHNLDLHQKLEQFWCKTRFCEQLLTKYVSHAHLKAKVLYVGHTSMDPTVAHEYVPRNWNGFLHVRGYSYIKHSREVLQCWHKHPEFPRLTVVGHFPNPIQPVPEIRTYMGSKNIRFIPAPASMQKYHPLSMYELQQLQMTMGVHICPSMREGFGHYINEGRGAGALVLTPNHPPMNELVDPHSGVYIQPYGSFSSETGPALRHFANLSAKIDPAGICTAVKKVLNMSIDDRAKMGWNARTAFLSDRHEFVHRIMHTLTPQLRQTLSDSSGQH